MNGKYNILSDQKEGSLDDTIDSRVLEVCNKAESDFNSGNNTKLPNLLNKPSTTANNDRIFFSLNSFSPNIKSSVVTPPLQNYNVKNSFSNNASSSKKNNNNNSIHHSKSSNNFNNVGPKTPGYFNSPNTFLSEESIFNSNNVKKNNIHIISHRNPFFNGYKEKVTDTNSNTINNNDQYIINNNRALHKLSQNKINTNFEALLPININRESAYNQFRNTRTINYIHSNKNNNKEHHFIPSSSFYNSQNFKILTGEISSKTQKKKVFNKLSVEKTGKTLNKFKFKKGHSLNKNKLDLNKVLLDSKTFIKNHKYQQAYDLLKSQINLGIQHSDLFYLYGEVNRILKNYKESEDYLILALYFKTHSPYIFYSLGLLYQEVGELEHSNKFFKLFIQLFDNADCNFLIAKNNFELGDFEQAAEFIDKAIKIKSDVEKYYTLRNDIYNSIKMNY